MVKKEAKEKSTSISLLAVHSPPVTRCPINHITYLLHSILYILTPVCYVCRGHRDARRPDGGTWLAVNYFNAPKASNVPRVLFTTLSSLGAA